MRWDKSLFVRQSTQNILIKQNTSVQQTYRSRGNITAQSRCCEAKQATKLLTKAQQKRVLTNFPGAEGIALHQTGVYEAPAPGQLTTIDPLLTHSKN